MIGGRDNDGYPRGVGRTAIENGTSAAWDLKSHSMLSSSLLANHWRDSKVIVLRGETDRPSWWRRSERSRLLGRRCRYFRRRETARRFRCHILHSRRCCPTRIRKGHLPSRRTSTSQSRKPIRLD